MSANKPVIESKFEGMDGSSSIAKIRENKCAWLENVKLKPGSVEKRRGYHKLANTPIRSIYSDAGSIYLEAVPLVTVTGIFMAFDSSDTLNRNINMWLKSNQLSITKNDNISVVVRIPDVPSDIQVTEDTLFRIGSEFFQPLHVFHDNMDEVVCLFNIKAVSAAGISMDNLYESAFVHNTEPIVIMNGHTFPSIKHTNIGMLAPHLMDDGKLTVSLKESFQFEWTLGTKVMFEGVWAGTSQDDLHYLTGTVVEYDSAELTIDIDEPLAEWQIGFRNPHTLTLVKDYIRIRILNSRILVDDEVYEDIKISGINSIYHEDWEDWDMKPRYLYGQPKVSSSPILSVNGVERLGLPFRFLAASNTQLYQLEGGEVLVAQPSPRVSIPENTKNLSRHSDGTYTIPVDNVNSLEVGDVIRLAYFDAEGTEFRYQLDVLHLNTDTNEIIAIGDVDVCTVFKGQSVNYVRNSQEITVADASTVVAGDMIKIGNIEHNFEVLEVDTSSPVGDVIVVDVPITYTSFDRIYLQPRLTPANIAEEYESLKPLDATTLPTEPIPTESTGFASTLVISNPHQMYTFNGAEFSRFSPPTPPTPLIRSVKGSRGYIPSKKDSNNVAIAPKVNIVVTYAWYDQGGTLYESPITPEEDLEIIPRVSTVLEYYCEMIEIQVPNVPRGLGYPADRMEIRAYVTAEGINRDMLMVLDQGSVVFNNPDAPTTTLLIGAAPYELNFTGYQLYSIQQISEGEETRTRGNNARPTLPKCLTTAMNRLFTAGGTTEPYFTLVCKEAFDKYTGEFSGWAELTQEDTTLHTVTLAGSYESPYYDIGWQTTETTFTPFKTSTVTKMLSSITYEDYSRGCRLEFVNETDVDNYSEDTEVALRTFGPVSEREYPLDFTGGIFWLQTKGLDYLDLQAYEGQWSMDFSDVTSLDTETYVFEHAYTIPPSRFGTLGGDHLVIAHMGDGMEQPEITLRISDLVVDWLTPLVDELIVVHGLSTRGNFRVRGTSRRLSWDRDLYWKVTHVETASGDSNLFPGGKIAYLQPYYQGKVLEIDRQFSQISSEQNSFLMNEKGVRIYKLLAPHEPATVISQLEDPPSECNLEITGHGYSEGDYLCVEHMETVPYYLPSFTNTKVIDVVDADNITVECNPLTTSKFGTSTETFSETFVTRIYSPSGGESLFDDSTGNLNIRIPNDYEVGDWVFMLTRGHDHFSTCYQLSCYFKVIASDADTFTVASNEAVRFNNVASISLGGVLHSPTVEGHKYVPIPVGKRLGALDSLSDLAMPMFSAKGIPVPLNQTIKRIALAFNSVFNNSGFAYWGGAVDGIIPYPENGIKIVAHRFPIDRYKEFTQVEGDYSYSQWNPTSEEYLKPFDHFSFTGDNYRLECFDIESGRIQSGLPSGDFTYRLDPVNSRVHWTEPTGDRPAGGGVYPQFKVGEYQDLNSNDGDIITAMTPFQDFLLVFKNHSVWRLEFTEDGILVSDKLTYAVGAVNHKCVVATPTQVFFVHDTGVYVTDGVEIKLVDGLERYFREGVRQHAEAMRHTCSVFDPEETEIHISLPYLLEGSVSNTTGQFTYAERESIQGWTYNSIPDVTVWFQNRNDLMFARDNTIWKQAKGTDMLKYRDGSEPITSIVRTRYEDASNAGQYKFFTRAAFQVGGEGNVTIGFASNYTPDYRATMELPLVSKGFGVQAWGGSFYGTLEIMESLRVGATPNRAVSLSLEIKHSELDKNFELSGVWFEGIPGNLKTLRSK